MNPEQDCKSIRQQAIIMFCHDFGAIAGSLASYSYIFNQIATENLSLDNISTPELLQNLQSGKQHSASRFTSLNAYFTSNLERCETELSDILEQINAVYQDDFKVWYVYLKQLEEHYLANGQIDLELTNLLIHHADNLSQFLLSLRDEANNLLSQID